MEAQYLICFHDVGFCMASDFYFLYQKTVEPLKRVKPCTMQRPIIFHLLAQMNQQMGGDILKNYIRNHDINSILVASLTKPTN